MTTQIHAAGALGAVSPGLAAALAEWAGITPTQVEEAVADYLTLNPPTAAPDATAAVKGVVALTGDLGGTAAAPTVPGLTGKVNKGQTITPDDFTGTDVERLQAAVDYSIANSYLTIRLDRMLNLTGADPVSVDKVNWYDRESVTFVGMGGGIIKHDAGVVFTSATENTGDLTFRGVKFTSTAGAGAVLLDCDKLLRIYSTGCEYHEWDTIARQVTEGRWAQSMRFAGEKIIGGAGPAFYLRESIDCTFSDVLCEDRLTGTEGGLFANSDGTMTTIANRNLRIVNCVIENNSGPAVTLAMCFGVILQGNYFEHNGAPTDSHIDLHSLADTQISVTLVGNMFNLQAGQIAARTPAVLLGPGRAQDLVTSMSNACEAGVLYKFGGVDGQIHSTGDTIEASGHLIYPGQEDRFFTTGVKATTTAARPGNPRLMETYFDTILGKPIWAETIGTVAQTSVAFSAGASSSGTITITLLGTPYTVPVTAGDTLTQVRDKVVAASATFFPQWKTRPFDVDLVAFDALVRGQRSGSVTFDAGGTGVTTYYLALDVPGTDPVWVDATGTPV